MYFNSAIKRNMVNSDRKWLAILRNKTTWLVILRKETTSQRISACLQYAAHDPTPLVTNDKSTIKRKYLISKHTESELYPDNKSPSNHIHDSPGRTIKLLTIQIPPHLLTVNSRERYSSIVRSRNMVNFEAYRLRVILLTITPSNH